MNNTAIRSPEATPTLAANSPKLSLSVLKNLFETLPDPRAGQPNLRYPLAAMLLAALVALLCNHLNELAIAQWLADQPLAIKQALGFPSAKTPHQTTFNRLFRRLSIDPLESALTHLFEPTAGATLRARGSQGIAIDGKCQRTRAKFKTEGAESKGTPCHLLSLFVHQLGLVLAQTAIENKEAELTVAPHLLAQIEWLGRVLTGDAIFCQRNLGAWVVEAGGDYFFAVKANQPTLEDDLKRLFEAPTPAETARLGFEAPAPLELTKAKTANKGHGRLEVREITASSELALYSDWPYLAQAVEIKRWWQNAAGESQQETWLGISSLPYQIANLKRLLEFKRDHWGIENRLHWVRDVVFGEDKSTLHTGSGPQLLAILRNLVLNLLRLNGCERITETLRANSRSTHRALALLGLVLNA
jgi:predicted transposase YbfD/YdcC